MAVVVVGSYNHDLIFNTHDQLPSEGETRLGDFAEAHGGKGFNQAVACHRLGVPTTFVGAIGNDSFAEHARQFAEDEGLSCEWQVFDGLSTGLASVTTDDRGHNLIVVAPGANNAMTMGHLQRLESIFETADVLLTQLESNLEAVAEAIALARKHRCLVILDPAPINASATLELIRSADIITPNRNEFVWLVNHLLDQKLDENWVDRNDMRLHEVCREIGVDTVVLTLGEDGCFVSHDDASRFAGEVTSYRVPAVTAEAVDSTGAGDAYAGALAAALARGDRFREALEFAGRAAAISVSRSGAAPSMPRIDELG